MWIFWMGSDPKWTHVFLCINDEKWNYYAFIDKRLCVDSWSCGNTLLVGYEIKRSRPGPHCSFFQMNNRWKKFQAHKNNFLLIRCYDSLSNRLVVTRRNSNGGIGVRILIGSYECESPRIQFAVTIGKHKCESFLYYKVEKYYNIEILHYLAQYCTINSQCEQAPGVSNFCSLVKKEPRFPLKAFLFSMIWPIKDED